MKISQMRNGFIKEIGGLAGAGLERGAIDSAVIASIKHAANFLMTPLQAAAGLRFWTRVCQRCSAASAHPSFSASARTWAPAEFKEKANICAAPWWRRPASGGQSRGQMISCVPAMLSQVTRWYYLPNVNPTRADVDWGVMRKHPPTNSAREGCARPVIPSRLKEPNPRRRRAFVTQPVSAGCLLSRRPP